MCDEETAWSLKTESVFCSLQNPRVLACTLAHSRCLIKFVDWVNEWIIVCYYLFKPKFLARLQCHSSFSFSPSSPWLCMEFLGSTQENKFAAFQAQHALLFYITWSLHMGFTLQHLAGPGTTVTDGEITVAKNTHGLCSYGPCGPSFSSKLGSKSPVPKHFPPIKHNPLKLFFYKLLMLFSLYIFALFTFFLVLGDCVCVCIYIKNLYTCLYIYI